MGNRFRGEVALTGVSGSMTIPMAWPEQKVKIIKEDLSPGVRIRPVDCHGGRNNC